MDSIEQILAHNLRERRKAAGLSQEALAEMAGFGITTIARWELGLRWPRLEELKKVCAILKVPTAALYQANGIKVSPTPQEALETLRDFVQAQKPAPILKGVPTPKDELIELINSLVDPNDIEVAIRQIQTVRRLRVDHAHRKTSKSGR